MSLQPGSGFRRHVEAAFAGAGVAFRPAIEVGNLSLVRRFVAAGLGWAPVPEVAFAEPGRGVARAEVAGIPPVVYHRAVRTRTPVPEAASRLLALLREA